MEDLKNTMLIKKSVSIQDLIHLNISFRRNSRPGVLKAEACNFIKKEILGQMFFPVNFANFLRTQFFTDQLR